MYEPRLLDACAVGAIAVGEKVVNETRREELDEQVKKEMGADKRKSNPKERQCLSVDRHCVAQGAAHTSAEDVEMEIE